MRGTPTPAARLPTRPEPMSGTPPTPVTPPTPGRRPTAPPPATPRLMRTGRGIRPPGVDVGSIPAVPQALGSAFCCSRSPGVDALAVAPDLKVQVETADMMTARMIPTKTDGFVSRDIADDTIIVPVRGGVGDLNAIFTLNAVGTTIWKLIDGATPLERLAGAIAAEYEVSPEDAARDVLEFVQLLTDKGLLATAPEETGKT